MKTRRVAAALLLTGGTCLASGCASPYYADRGAVFGGVMGAGLGAVAGAAMGDPLAGAAIGGVAGTVTGAVAGGAIDDVEARNRAEIAARTGRPAPVGAVSVPEIVAMTQAGVSEEVIATHVRSHGLIGPLQSGDLIYLQQCGVSPRVVQAMQTTPGPVPAVAAVPAYPPPPIIVERSPPPIIIEEHCHGPYPPHYWRHHHHHHPPRVGWGFSVTSDNF